MREVVDSTVVLSRPAHGEGGVLLVINHRGSGLAVSRGGGEPGHRSEVGQGPGFTGAV